MQLQAISLLITHYSCGTLQIKLTHWRQAYLVTRGGPAGTPGAGSRPVKSQAIHTMHMPMACMTL